jgi:hypothetical protein
MAWHSAISMINPRRPPTLPVDFDALPQRAGYRLAGIENLYTRYSLPDDY